MHVIIDLPDHLCEWLQSDDARRHFAGYFDMVDEEAEEPIPLEVPIDLPGRAVLAIERAYQAAQPLDDQIPF